MIPKNPQAKMRIKTNLPPATIIMEKIQTQILVMTKSPMWITQQSLKPMVG